MTELETTEIPVYVSPVTKKKPEQVREIDYYEEKQPRSKHTIASPDAEVINHLYCCDEEISLCGLDLRSHEDAPAEVDSSVGDCIVCVKYDASSYHTCPLCGRF